MNLPFHCLPPTPISSFLPSFIALTLLSFTLSTPFPGKEMKWERMGKIRGSFYILLRDLRFGEARNWEPGRQTFYW